MMEPGTYANLEIDIELKNRTEQDNIYETLQHGTGELADKTTPSAKKCTPLLFWCTLVNSILIGLLIIAVSVSLYMCINVSKASNSKESIRSIAADVRHIKNDLENNTSGLDNLKVVTDEINKKCEDGLSDLSKNLERQTNDLRSSSTESIKNVSEVVVNIKKDVEKSTSGLDDLKTVTDEIKEQMKRLDQATEKKTQVIAFNVADAVNYPGNDAIKFSNIILNEGDAYNKETGIFTAPLDGIYQFNAHICGNETVEEIDYYIAVNSQWIVTGEFTAPARSYRCKMYVF
ncbi:uncharacterized protein LOC132719986 [Ruditapes philippinarum]|uniref:uncharacterized protein LOC132719986 n=1 Tax=Ruditapes philippinarum TaxID=129788 RepID=UPI00295A86D2|nr:uncharacterized protein LOC132719986 [Ruditapes philippinarum]